MLAAPPSAADCSCLSSISGRSFRTPECSRNGAPRFVGARATGLWESRTILRSSHHQLQGLAASSLLAAVGSAGPSCSPCLSFGRSLPPRRQPVRRRAGRGGNSPPVCSVSLLPLSRKICVPLPASSSQRGTGMYGWAGLGAELWSGRDRSWDRKGGNSCQGSGVPGDGGVCVSVPLTSVPPLRTRPRASSPPPHAHSLGPLSLFPFPIPALILPASAQRFPCT